MKKYTLSKLYDDSFKKDILDIVKQGMPQGAIYSSSKKPPEGVQVYRTDRGTEYWVPKKLQPKLDLENKWKEKPIKGLDQHIPLTSNNPIKVSIAEEKQNRYKELLGRHSVKLSQKNYSDAEINYARKKLFEAIKERKTAIELLYIPELYAEKLAQEYRLKEILAKPKVTQYINENKFTPSPTFAEKEKKQRITIDGNKYRYVAFKIEEDKTEKAIIFKLSQKTYSDAEINYARKKLFEAIASKLDPKKWRNVVSSLVNDITKRDNQLYLVERRSPKSKWRKPKKISEDSKDKASKQ